MTSFVCFDCIFIYLFMDFLIYLFSCGRESICSVAISTSVVCKTIKLFLSLYFSNNARLECLLSFVVIVYTLCCFLFVSGCIRCCPNKFIKIFCLFVFKCIILKGTPVAMSRNKRTGDQKRTGKYVFLSIFFSKY